MNCPITFAIDIFIVQLMAILTMRLTFSIVVHSLSYSFQMFRIYAQADLALMIYFITIRYVANIIQI